MLLYDPSRPKTCLYNQEIFDEQDGATPVSIQDLEKT